MPGMNKMNERNHDGSMTDKRNHDGNMTANRVSDMVEKLLEDQNRKISCQHDGKARYITTYHMQRSDEKKRKDEEKKGKWINRKGTYLSVIPVMPSWVFLKVNKLNSKHLYGDLMTVVHSTQNRAFL